MNNAAAIHELNRALAQFRRRQSYAPTPHSAREIAQMSVMAEYLYAKHQFWSSAEPEALATQLFNPPHNKAA